jgi:hypothetical protein
VIGCAAFTRAEPVVLGAGVLVEENVTRDMQELGLLLATGRKVWMYFAYPASIGAGDRIVVGRTIYA